MATSYVMTVSRNGQVRVVRRFGHEHRLGGHHDSTSYDHFLLRREYR